MEYSLPPHHANIPPEKLIGDLKRAAKKLKSNVITMKQYESCGKYSSATLARRLGGWHSALQKAGLEPAREMYIAPAELMKNLKQTWDKLGRKPDQSEMRKPHSKYSVRPYTYCFGSWRGALELFIRYANAPSEAEKKKILKGMERIKSRRTKRHVSGKLRYCVLQRDKYKCRLCGSSPATNPKVKLHVDHIIPWSKGGETVIDNLQTLCEDCNLGKGNQS